MARLGLLKIGGVVAAALGLSLAACQPPETATTAATEAVGAGMERVAIASDHDDATLTAYLSKPEGDGPFPAVVLQHGCGGLVPIVWRGSKRHAELLNDNGYVTLIVDSFGPRGVATACEDVLTYYPVLVHDADPLFDYMASLPYVDRARIGYAGFSLGGVAALFVASNHFDALTVQRDYAAVVAYYPHCGNWQGYYRFDERPLLIMIGAADDWTPPAPCRALADHWSGQVETIVYPDAHHSFDMPFESPVRTTGDDGTGLSTRTVAADPAALRDSQARMVAFFDRHLAPPQ